MKKLTPLSQLKSHDTPSNEDLSLKNELNSDSIAIIKPEIFPTINANLQANLDNNLDEIPVNDRSIGFGFNELRGRWSGSSAVEFEDENDLTSIGTSQDVLFIAQKITSYASLREKLNLDVRVSLGFNGFGADFTSNIYSNSFLSSFKQYILVQVSVVNAPQILKNQKLTKNAANIALKSYENFVENFGTKYVIGKKTGGKLYGLIEIEATDEQNFKEVSKSLNISVGLFGSANAKFAETIQTISKKNSVKTTIVKSGGDAKYNTSPDELIKDAENFAEEVKKDPKVLSLMLSEYNGVIDYPFEYASTKNSLRLDNVINEQKTIATHIEKLTEFLNDVNYMKLNSDLFEATLVSKITDFVKQANSKKSYYFDLNNQLIQDFIDGKNVISHIEDTEIPQIVRKEGWNNTKGEVFVKTHDSTQITSNWDGESGFLTYGFEFSVPNAKHILKNVRIEHSGCVNISGPGCYWNFGSGFLVPNFEYINGTNHIRGTFYAGGHSMAITVKCDEFELK
jgi:hypothetical protein